MNASSESIITIKSWIKSARNRLLSVGIPSAQLDAEILLRFVINKPRTYIHAHPERIINESSISRLEKLLNDRSKRMPIAYLVGSKEFYGRNFLVTPDVLIPRPESEIIIDTLKKISNYDKSLMRLYDIGTGSGCLGITAKLEIPDLDVTISDISKKSLDIARKNAQKLSAKVKIIQSNLLSSFSTKPDIIIANLPYVDVGWKCSEETKYEPSLALFADNKGLCLIQRLIRQSSCYDNIILILEFDPVQMIDITKYATKLGFSIHQQSDYVAMLKKSS